MKFEKKPVPAELVPEAKEWRDKMIEPRPRRTKRS